MVTHLAAYIERLRDLAAKAESHSDMAKAHSLRLEIARTVQQIKVLSKPYKF
jgi:hypothetical protein